MERRPGCFAGCLQGLESPRGTSKGLGREDWELDPGLPSAPGARCSRRERVTTRPSPPVRIPVSGKQEEGSTSLGEVTGGVNMDSEEALGPNQTPGYHSLQSPKFHQGFRRLSSKNDGCSLQEQNLSEEAAGNPHQSVTEKLAPRP